MYVCVISFSAVQLAKRTRSYNSLLKKAAHHEVSSFFALSLNTGGGSGVGGEERKWKDVLKNALFGEIKID